MTTNTTTKRRCKGKTCLTLLNQYNDGDYCHACMKKRSDEEILRFREQMERREEAERQRQEALKSGEKQAVKRYTKADLIEIIKQMENDLQRTPRADDCSGLYPSTATFIRHFGTWTAALRVAEMIPKATTRELILECLRSRKMAGADIALKIKADADNVSHLLSDLYRKGLVDREKQKRVGKTGMAGYLYWLTTSGKAGDE